MLSSEERPFAGRTVIVTGAGTGLGRAHARTFAALGADVVVNGLPEREGALSPVEEVAAGIATAGGSAIAVHASVAETGAGEQIVAAALEAFGRVDVVVNNAGILRDGPLLKRTRDDWNAVLGVHLDGAYELTRAAWPHLVEQGFGRVIVTSSAAGIYGTANNASYGAAKLGVVGLARMLAAEAQGLGVDLTVNAIAPLALTPMSASGGDRDRAADVVGDLFAAMPPEQVSQAVAWLTHPDCDVTGRLFSVGGGRVAEVVLAEAFGWTAPGHSWQDVRDNWHAVTDLSDYQVPIHISDELKLFMEALA